jgi:flagellar biogenesis protein FliO
MAALWLLQTAGTSTEISALHSDVYEYLKLFLVFGLVLVCVLVVLRLWFPRMSGLRQSSSGPILVVARYPLEAKKNLYIVQAAGSYFLLGTSEAGVHYLTPLEAAAVELSVPAETETGGLDFSRLIHSFKRGTRGS